MSQVVCSSLRFSAAGVGGAATPQGAGPRFAAVVLRLRRLRARAGHGRRLGGPERWLLKLWGVRPPSGFGSGPESRRRRRWLRRLAQLRQWWRWLGYHGPSAVRLLLQPWRGWLLPPLAALLRWSWGCRPRPLPAAALAAPGWLGPLAAALAEEAVAVAALLEAQMAGTPPPSVQPHYGAVARPWLKPLVGLLVGLAQSAAAEAGGGGSRRRRQGGGGGGSPAAANPSLLLYFAGAEGAG